MSETLWIKSHVELLLQREWEVCQVAIRPGRRLPVPGGHGRVLGVGVRG